VCPPPTAGCHFYLAPTFWQCSASSWQVDERRFAPLAGLTGGAAVAPRCAGADNTVPLAHRLWTSGCVRLIQINAGLAQGEEAARAPWSGACVMFSFQTFPQRSPEGWGHSRPRCGRGLTPPSRGAPRPSVPVVLWQRVGPGIAGPSSYAFRCRDRPPGIDAPTRWAQRRAPALIQLGRPPPLAGCPRAALFPRHARPQSGQRHRGVKRFRSRRLHPLQVPVRQRRQELVEESPNGKVRFRCSGRHRHHLGHHGRGIVALSAGAGDDGRHRACKLVDRSCSASHVVIAGAVLIP
jgi:hypothetical protein